MSVSEGSSDIGKNIPLIVICRETNLVIRDGLNDMIAGPKKEKFGCSAGLFFPMCV